ncbi:MAG: efflux RND transporter permease subunit [Aquificae bacterium]|nr:efflux RND transporter permease subunit [Aquificota bacterium]
MTEYFLKRPHFVLTLIFAFSFLGIIGFFNIKQKLFPDANRPSVAVVIVQKGASAKDIAENIAIPVERRLYTIDKIRSVSSVSNDEVAVITAEFEYEKDINQAVVDVQNEINKIKSKLPKNIKEPQIYKITEATQPVMVLAVYPKDNSIPLADVRQIAENQIRDKLLKLSEVANVDIFGGYRKEVFLKIDKDKLNEYQIPISLVLEKIQQTNVDIPIGFLVSKNGEFLVKSVNKAQNIHQLKEIYITPNIKLADVSKIEYDYPINKSLYIGNGKKAIAVAIQRQQTGDSLKTINQVKQIIPQLKQEFPLFEFEVTDTQEKIIRLSNLNMLEALRDAIIMTSLVIFFFLSNIRQMIIAGISIPFVYAITIGLMWIFGIEFNIVSLTAIILALGMLIDDAIVVLENIERHLYQLKEDVKDAVINGTKEVIFPVLAGTIATSSVLVPLLFVGDYPEKIFRPLAETLLIAVIVSYFVSIFFIPVVAPFLLKKDAHNKNLIERITLKISTFVLNPLKNLYVSAVNIAMDRKSIAILYFLGVIIVFVLSVRIIIPLVGREIMPPMDTGIVKVDITTDSNLSIQKVEKIAEKISKFLQKDDRVIMFSLAVGSEAGVLSMSSGKPTQSISITIHYTDRFHRKETIWEIEDQLRKEIWQIPDLKYVQVFDYGATPLASIKGNLDVRISGDDLHTLYSLGNKVMDIAYNTKGIVSLSKSWDYDKVVYRLELDHQKLTLYSVTPYMIASQLGTKIRGSYVSILNVPNEESLFIKVVYPKKDRISTLDLENYYIDTPKGKIPLTQIASLEKTLEPTIITRQDLAYTIDILGFREKAAISHIVDSFKTALENSKISLPAGYTISNEGDLKQLNDSMKRMFIAIGIGIVLLFLALAPAFNSFLAPIAVIFAIPLSIIGASWSILLANFHQSMPGLMGIILLAGIITKNSILLIDFIQKALEEGKNLKQAVLDSIKIRTRPVLMTAFGTSVGMIPIAFGWALGLERLAPLGVVAIGGLIIGTFLTLVYVPLLYYFLRRATKS